MNIELNISPENFTIITATLQAVYNSKATTRRTKSTLSVAIDVVNKFDSKLPGLKKITLFDTKKKIKIKLKFHEADILELILIDQLKTVEENYIRHQIQKTIDILNQKLT